MAVPKKRTTKSKRNQRRSHDALKRSCPIICPNCGASVMPHHACLACGTYRGRKVIDVEENE